LTFKKTNGNPASHGTPVKKRWIKNKLNVFVAGEPNFKRYYSFNVCLTETEWASSLDANKSEEN